MIKTYDMSIHYRDGSIKNYYNISRVAVKRFKEWYAETLYVDRIIFHPCNGQSAIGA